ncbi:MAG TPA: DMT family transporter, partial [Alphaproteobacteria bacterium]
MSRRNAIFVFVVLILIWGLNWPIMKIGLAHISPAWFTALRMLSSIPCLFAVLLVQGRVSLPKPQDIPVLLSVGLLQMALFMGLTNFALQRVPAGRAAILAYTTPLWVTPLAAIFLKERLSALKLIGVALGMLGVVVLFNPLGFDWSERRVVVGNGLLMLAAFLWALCIVHVRRHRWHATTLELMPWQMMLGAAPLVLFAY